MLGSDRERRRNLKNGLQEVDASGGVSHFSMGLAEDAVAADGASKGNPNLVARALGLCSFSVFTLLSDSKRAWEAAVYADWRYEVAHIPPP